MTGADRVFHQSEFNEGGDTGAASAPHPREAKRLAAVYEVAGALQYVSTGMDGERVPE